MKPKKVIATLFSFLYLLCCSYAADNKRCNSPPYGGTVSDYNAYMKSFSYLFDNPHKIPSYICKIKFFGADRTTMYNLGFTDNEINHSNVYDLSVNMVIALKRFTDKLQ
jgi:hypothetical protein